MNILQFARDTCPRKVTVVRAMFHYMALQAKAERELLSLSIARIEEIDGFDKLSDFEKILTRLAVFEIDKVEGLDEYDMAELWGSFIARPVTEEEVNLLLEQPMKAVLQLTEQLEPIEPSVICEGA